MNKSELVANVASEVGMSKAEADRAISAILESIKEAMARGEQVSLIGFGTFDVSERAARTGRNPQNGEEIKIAAAKLPKFKPGKYLKDAVN